MGFSLFVSLKYSYYMHQKIKSVVKFIHLLSYPCIPQMILHTKRKSELLAKWFTQHLQRSMFTLSQKTNLIKAFSRMSPASLQPSSQARQYKIYILMVKTPISIKCVFLLKLISSSLSFRNKCQYMIVIQHLKRVIPKWKVFIFGAICCST